MYKNTSKK